MHNRPTYTLLQYTGHLHRQIRMRTFYKLPQPHHVTAFHPSPGDKPAQCSRSVRKNAGTKQKNGSVKINHLHMYQGSPLLPILCTLSRSLHHLSLCCPRPPSQNLSNPILIWIWGLPHTSVYPI